MHTRRITNGLSLLAGLALVALFAAVGVAIAIAVVRGDLAGALGGLAFLAAAALCVAGGGR